MKFTFPKVLIGIFIAFVALVIGVIGRMAYVDSQHEPLSKLQLIYFQRTQR